MAAELYQIGFAGYVAGWSVAQVGDTLSATPDGGGLEDTRSIAVEGLAIWCAGREPKPGWGRFPVVEAPLHGLRDLPAARAVLAAAPSLIARGSPVWSSVTRYRIVIGRPPKQRKPRYSSTGAGSARSSATSRRYSPSVTG